MEKSHAFDADVRITCRPPCRCAPTADSTHSNRKFTYIRRSEPAWCVPANGRCDVQVHVHRLRKGVVAIKAATLAAPIAGNNSVNTDTLYHLGYERPVVLSDAVLKNRAFA